MKRQAIIMTCAMLMASLSACKDDASQPEALSERTYTGMNVLTMTYDGAPMSGKSVRVTPNEACTEADMMLYSSFDLSTLGDQYAGMSLPAPGVLPGTPQLYIHTALHPDGDAYTFSGSGDTDYVSYSYSGRVSRSEMTFALTDVSLKDQSMASQVWSPAPLERDASGTAWKSSPLFFIWEVKQLPELAEVLPTVDLAGQMLDMLATMPLIPVYNGTAYMSPAQMVASGLRTLGFNGNGNLVVTYLQTAQGAAQFAQAPLCMVQYLPAGEQLMRLYVNPTDVLSVVLLNNTNRDPNIPENPFGAPAMTRDDTAASTASQLTDEERAALKAWGKEIATQMITQVAPMLPQGIPAHYVVEGTAMKLYIGQETFTPMLKLVLASLATNAEVQAILLKMAQSDPIMMQYLPQLQKMLEAMPALLEATTRLDAGLNLVRAQ